MNGGVIKWSVKKITSGCVDSIVVITVEGAIWYRSWNRGPGVSGICVSHIGGKAIVVRRTNKMNGFILGVPLCAVAKHGDKI